MFASLRRELGAVVPAFNRLSQEQIVKILDFTQFLIATTLRHLHPVLLVPIEDSKEIRIFHKSFPGFLQDYKLKLLRQPLCTISHLID